MIAIPEKRGSTASEKVIPISAGEEEIVPPTAGTALVSIAWAETGQGSNVASADKVTANQNAGFMGALPKGIVHVFEDVREIEFWSL